MRNYRARAVSIALVCALALSACTVAPHGKTLMFTPDPKAAATASPAPGALGLIKAYPIELDKLDQAGYFYNSASIVCGWLDNDHIIALGTEPVAGATGELPYTDAERKLLQEKYAKAGRMSTKGIVGHILSVDWRTGKTVSLHASTDTAYTSLGLAHDKSKLWYLSTGADGTNKLSVTDSSFTHDMRDIPDYMGVNPSWSSLDKYLYYIDYSKEGKARPAVTLFDGVTSSVLPYTELSYMGMSLIGIDDKTSTAWSIIKDALVISVPLPGSDEKPARDTPILTQRNINAGKEATPYIYRAAWIGTDYVVMLGSSRDGGSSSMGILDINSKDSPYWHDDILNFVFSDDGKYICLVKQAGKVVDITVAEWRNGQINNNTFLFNMIAPPDAIYFSPDDTKLLLAGWFETSSKVPSAKVIQIR